MIYLYFNRGEKVLYGYDNLMLMGTHTYQIKWDNIESVTTDYERGQVVAHEFSDIATSKVIEFPIGLTLLSCKVPININK